MWVIDSYIPKHILLKVINSSVTLGTGYSVYSRAACPNPFLHSPQTLHVGWFPCSPFFSIFHYPEFKKCSKNSLWSKCRISHPILDLTFRILEVHQAWHITLSINANQHLSTSPLFSSLIHPPKKIQRRKIII